VSRKPQGLWPPIPKSAVFLGYFLGVLASDDSLQHGVGLVGIRLRCQILWILLFDPERPSQRGI
jgi:hypothetical protein